MRFTVTWAPSRKGVSGPPFEVTVVCPRAGTPWSDSFHASTCASAFTPASERCVELKLPIVATPVDSVLKPPAWAPITGSSMPPWRPSNTCPYLSTSML